MTFAERRAKLVKLAEIAGLPNVADLVERAAYEPTAPGICSNQGCDYSREVQPDQDRGWCEVCGASTVKSSLVLANLI